MVFGSTSTVSGVLSSTCLGVFEGVFFGQPFTATAIEYFDAASGETLHFTGSSSFDAYDYEFTLSEGQIAWGMLFDWGLSSEPAFLNIMNCGDGQPGDVCNGLGTPMQTGPFPGQAPSFNGVVVSAVPVPATFFLLGAGVLTIAGISIRREKV